jgi:hypothetical protein
MRPDQIIDILDKVRGIAEACEDLIVEAAAQQSSEEIDESLAEACDELNVTVERLFDVANFIFLSTCSGGLTIH